MVCQPSDTLEKIGPIAKASAGSAKPIVINAPAPCTVPVMKRRRVTVSPSKAPGIPRSSVYLDLLGLRVGANDAPRDRAGTRISSGHGAARIQRGDRGGRARVAGEHEVLHGGVALVAPVTDRAGPGAP